MLKEKVALLKEKYEEKKKEFTTLRKTGTFSSINLIQQDIKSLKRELEKFLFLTPMDREFIFQNSDLFDLNLIASDLNQVRHQLTKKSFFGKKKSEGQQVKKEKEKIRQLRMLIFKHLIIKSKMEENKKIYSAIDFSNNFSREQAQMSDKLDAQLKKNIKQLNERKVTQKNQLKCLEELRDEKLQEKTQKIKADLFQTSVKKQKENEFLKGKMKGLDEFLAQK